MQLLILPANANNGQIYIGLCFKHVSSSLTVAIDSARNLNAVNLATQDSDPYTKYAFLIVSPCTCTYSYKLQVQSILLYYAYYVCRVHYRNFVTWPDSGPKFYEQKKIIVAVADV